MIRLLSFIYPITKKITSKFNGTLEITWHNGKKHLNTKNANYSYGSLQKILKFGLQKINLTGCKKILLLGMGGGSVIKTLRDDVNYKNHITAVEIDPVIIKIAKDEFDIYETENLQIVCEDAQIYMQLNTQKYDLIIIDLYIDTNVPNAFLKTPFWQNIIKANSGYGSILSNASLQKTDRLKLDTIVRFLKQHQYKVDVLEKVNKTNTLFIAKLVS